MKKRFLAIDIGASSGRHIVGWTEKGEIVTEEVYRFANVVEENNGHLTWNLTYLFEQVLQGIKKAFLRFGGSIVSLAIDTWGVDYVLMNGDKEVMPCYAYRDNRTQKVIEKVHEIVSFDELYSRTGVAFQPFNSVYQLYDDLTQNRLTQATDFLMIPEYLTYKLTGIKVKEYTNATTTSLVAADSSDCDLQLACKLGLPEALFKPLAAPGKTVGNLLSEVAQKVGGQAKVVLVASHDTASAVEGIPMQGDYPYISSGTWSLLGVKVPKAITTCPNYSNEGGVNYVRYQKNIMGLWLVQCLQKELCPNVDFAEIAGLAEQSNYTHIVDVYDNSFLSPQSMKQALDTYLTNQAEPLPQTSADYFACAYRSLAYGYKRALAELSANTGRQYTEICVVGGGAKNQYLNKLTEQICSIKVRALPIEATALGNLKVQMEAK